MLKNNMYYKLLVFCFAHWLAKEEMPSSKITSLLALSKQMDVKEMKYFKT